MNFWPMKSQMNFLANSILYISKYFPNIVERCLENLNYLLFSSVQFSCSVVSYSLRPHDTAARQASLSITNSWILLKLMSITSVLPSNHLILCRPVLLLSSVFPSIRVFSNELMLHIRWPNIGVSASS